MKTTIAKWTTRSASAAAISSRVSRDGAPGIGDPVAPGAGVELRARQAGDLYREEVVAGGHARAAVVHHFARRPLAEDLQEFLLQVIGLLERALGADVVGGVAVPRARDVAGDAVDRLFFAAKALRRAGVKQQHALGLMRDKADADRSLGAHPDGILGARKARDQRADRPALGHPLGKAAVEHRDRIVTDP